MSSMNWLVLASISLIARSRLPLMMRWPFVVQPVAKTQSLWLSNLSNSFPSATAMMRTELSAPPNASRSPSGDQEMP